MPFPQTSPHASWQLITLKEKEEMVLWVGFFFSYDILLNNKILTPSKTCSQKEKKNHLNFVRWFYGKYVRLMKYAQLPGGSLNALKMGPEHKGLGMSVIYSPPSSWAVSKWHFLSCHNVQFMCLNTCLFLFISDASGKRDTTWVWCILIQHPKDY